jgi:hypothetical protein
VLPIRHHEIVCEVIEALREAEADALLHVIKHPEDDQARCQLRRLMEAITKVYAI